MFFFLHFSTTTLLADGAVMNGEVLKYKVLAYGVQIAEIEISTFRKFDHDGIPARSVRAEVSYRKFFDFSALFNSILKAGDSLYTLQSSRNIRFLRNTLSKHKFNYQYDSSRYIAQITDSDGKETKDTIKLKPDKKIYDPLALFFYARVNSDKKRMKMMNTHLMGTDFYTSLNFMGNKFKMNIDAAEYPVRTMHISGNADWKGVYLLTGAFNVWVSDDEAKVPILGTVETKFGVVTVELTKWKRLQWQPPEYVEKE